MTRPLPGDRTGRGCVLLLVLLSVLAGLLGPTAVPWTAAAAPTTDAVMRTTTVDMRADEVLTVDVLSNDDPPPGATWDRSSVCLVAPDGSCAKEREYAVNEFVFVYSVDEQGMIRYYSTARFPGQGGITYRVQDSRGTTWTASLEHRAGLTAVGSGVPPTDAPRPRLRVTNAVSPTTFDHAGQVLTWTSVVTNTGDVALPVKVTDTSPQLSARTCAPVANLGTLPPGASTTCTATSPVWQDFIDARSDRVDTVKVGATTLVDAQRYRAAAAATAVSRPVQRPGFSITTSVSPTTVSDADQPVAYTVVARNRGNVTLNDLVVRAPFPGLSALVCSPVPLGNDLAPGQTTTCRGTRTVPPVAPGTTTLTDTVRATARTRYQGLNATSQVRLGLDGVTSTPYVPVPAPEPVAHPDTAATTILTPVVVTVLRNDVAGSAKVPLVGSSVRLRLTPDLPAGSVLYGDVKVLVVPKGKASSTKGAPGGGVFLVSGRGEITFIPIGFEEPTPELTVGYQVADANGRTTRSTLTVTVGR